MMTTLFSHRLGVLGAVALLALVACGRPVAPDPGALADQVRAAETAFAKSMADRDLAAFSSHLADEAVFVSGERSLRGKTAVAGDWKQFFEGAQAPFAWRPERVEVLESGALALSSGPVFDPAGNRVGTFNSVWRRESDGSWKIVFDNGCPQCAACPPAASPGAV